MFEPVPLKYVVCGLRTTYLDVTTGSVIYLSFQTVFYTRFGSLCNEKIKTYNTKSFKFGQIRNSNLTMNPCFVNKSYTIGNDET